MKLSDYFTLPFKDDCGQVTDVVGRVLFEWITNIYYSKFGDEQLKDAIVRILNNKSDYIPMIHWDISEGVGYADSSVAFKIPPSEYSEKIGLIILSKLSYG